MSFVKEIDMFCINYLLLSKGGERGLFDLGFELLARLKHARAASQGELVIVPPGFRMLDYWKYQGSHTV